MWALGLEREWWLEGSGGPLEWKKVSQESADMLKKALADFHCEQKKMFGCPADFVNGNMFAGVHGEGLFLRLPVDAQLEFMAAHPEVTILEPMPGRRMKEYVVVPGSVLADEPVFLKWLSRSFDYAMSLPPKAPKPSKKG